MTCNTKTESHPGHSLLALLAGLGAGIVVGLAIAPKSGRQLRTDMSNTVDDYLDSASRKADELRKSATNLAQRGLRQVRKVDATVNGAVDAAATGAHGAIDQTVAAVNAGAQEGHAAINRAADSLRTGTRD